MWLAEPKLAKRAKAGGAEGDRTPDLLIANEALSQLSYGPMTAVAARDGGQKCRHLRFHGLPSQGWCQGRRIRISRANRALFGSREAFK
jgi:hypothetical protein